MPCVLVRVEEALRVTSVPHLQLYPVVFLELLFPEVIAPLDSTVNGGAVFSVDTDVGSFLHGPLFDDYGVSERDGLLHGARPVPAGNDDSVLL